MAPLARRLQMRTRLSRLGFRLPIRLRSLEYRLQPTMLSSETLKVVSRALLLKAVQTAFMVPAISGQNRVAWELTTSSEMPIVRVVPTRFQIDLVLVSAVQSGSRRCI